MELRPFQRRFVRGATRRGVDTAALSIPRGGGKTALAGHLLARGLTPGDPLHVPGAEYCLCAASVDQARLCFRFVRAALEPSGLYRFTDSSRSLGASGPARLKVISSNGKRAMGLVGVPLVVADEPASWEVTGGELMFDALQTAQGKAGSPLRVIYIGTLAPARGGWWHELVKAGSQGSTYVQALQGRPDRWDSWREIARVNPLVAVSTKFAAKLREERAGARRDPRLKARFLSYRLNVPSRDERDTLMSVDEWRAVQSRPEGLPVGRPVVGVDMGGARSWSAAVAVWPETGRVEAFAYAPGVPSLSDQEKRDRIPRGTCARLVADGTLHVAEGLHIPPAALVADKVLDWRPSVVICDRFRLPELRDAIRGRVPIVPRVGQWSEASEDIRALRRLALDGGMNVAPAARRLVARSLGESTVEADTSGNLRLTKTQFRAGADDVCAAWLLAAGEVDRIRRRPRRPLRIHRAS